MKKTDDDFSDISSVDVEMNVPSDKEDYAATDMLSEFVEQFMDNIQQTVDDEDGEEA